MALTAPLVYPRVRTLRAKGRLSHACAQVYTMHPLPERAGCLTGVADNAAAPLAPSLSTDGE